MHNKKRKILEIVDTYPSNGGMSVLQEELIELIDMVSDEEGAKTLRACLVEMAPKLSDDFILVFSTTGKFEEPLLKLFERCDVQTFSQLLPTTKVWGLLGSIVDKGLMKLPRIALADDNRKAKFYALIESNLENEAFLQSLTAPLNLYSNNEGHHARAGGVKELVEKLRAFAQKPEIPAVSGSRIASLLTEIQRFVYDGVTAGAVNVKRVTDNYDRNKKGAFRPAPEDGEGTVTLEEMRGYLDKGWRDLSLNPMRGYKRFRENLPKTVGWTRRQRVALARDVITHFEAKIAECNSYPDDKLGDQHELLPALRVCLRGAYNKIIPSFEALYTGWPERFAQARQELDALFTAPGSSPAVELLKGMARNPETWRPNPFDPE